MSEKQGETDGNNIERVLVPPKLRRWQDGDWSLFYDPYNFNWTRVNPSGRFLVERFARHRTVSQVTDDVVREFGLDPTQARTAVRKFVSGMVEEGFFHVDEYEERDRMMFPTRDFAAAVYAHLTNNCNLKCPYCYNKSDRDYKVQMEKKGLFRESLSTEEYKNVISRLVELGVEHIFFTGGEPLMRKDVFELIEHARSLSNDLTIEVLTNAILIKEPVAERLCELVNTVTISLDGHERHLHEFYRGRNTFAPTIRGIRTLIAARERLGQRSPYVAIVPALTNKNIGFMKAIFEYALDDLGADGLAPIIFQAGDHQELNLQQIPEFDEWMAANRETGRYLTGRAAKGQEHDNEPQARTEQGPRSVIPRHHCGVGNGEFSIDPSGYVYPCQTLHFDEFLCGNVRDQDVYEIFHNSPVMRKVRGTEVDTLKVCRHCDVRYLCNGGCRATSYNIYRQFDSHNEIYCRHLEQLAVNKMWAASSGEASAMEGGCI